MPKKALIVLILSLCVAALATSCVVLPLPWFVSFDEAAWTAAKAKWTAAGLSDYRYRQTSWGFSSFDSIITVSGSVAVSEELPPDPVVEGNTLSRDLWSMDDWFSNIFASYEQNNGLWAIPAECPLVGISVEYDPDLGYPRKIDYRYHIPTGVAWDGNPSWSLSDLTPTD